MGLILDSSILIASERRRFDLVAFLRSEAQMETVFIAAITASELLHGIHRAKPEFRIKREALVESFLRDMPIIAFDLVTARVHAKLWAGMEMAGNRIGPHDMQIASTCLSFGHKLATLNENEFQRVDGLTLANARPFVIMN